MDSLDSRLQIDDARSLASSFVPQDVLSPLRYPGGKRRLAPLVANLLEQMEYLPDLSVEPFAGGASVGLHLLVSGLSSRLGLADRDELIAAFWETVFFDSRWLISEVQKVDVSLERWEEFRKSACSDRRERALKCLFLNRTSFSGILYKGAGPIGGRQQTSSYGIGCRFNKKTITDRIEYLASFANRIAFVECCDWKESICLCESAIAHNASNDTFLYLDPPFFEKAGKLYRYSFGLDDHEALRDRLMDTAAPWLLSYDSPGEVRKLYAGKAYGEVRALYTVSSGKVPKGSGEALVSNFIELDGII